jgi:S-DNA-T family DNA segregation ATPase FtsK/SpoIIIE
LISANRSVIVGGVILRLAQLFGWGVYVLPLGLLVFGLWLVLRKIERVPPLTVERAVGSVILFLWLLTALHSIVTDAENAEVVALNGQGGGALGGLFQRLLYAGFGNGGLFIALIAWLIIGVAITLDKPVTDLFFWLKPLMKKIREILHRPVAPPTPLVPDSSP